MCADIAMPVAWHAAGQISNIENKPIAVPGVDKMSGSDLAFRQNGRLFLGFGLLHEAFHVDAVEGRLALSITVKIDHLTIG